MQSCKVVVLAFKAAYNMERTRRDNDKRITLLYVAMKDMLAALVQYVVSTLQQCQAYPILMHFR